MRTTNRNNAYRIREEIERSMRCEIDHLERNYNSYSFTVVGRNGQRISIAGDIAYHLTDGMSEDSRNQYIKLAPRRDYYEIPNDFFAGADFAIATSQSYSNYYRDTVYAQEQVKVVEKVKTKKLNKLKLLYWSYFQKKKEKAF